MGRALTGVIAAMGLALSLPAAAATADTGPVPPVDTGAACDSVIGAGEHDYYTPVGIVSLSTCDAADVPTCSEQQEQVDLSPVVIINATLCIVAPVPLPAPLP